MKKQYLTLIALVLFSSVYAQNETYTDIGGYGNPVLNYIDNIPEGKLYNNNMLDMLFAEQVGTYFNDDEDLTTQKYYTSLSTKDNSFSFAYTFNPCFTCVKTNRLSSIMTLGFKAKAGDNFAELYKNGDYTASTIGATLKFTKVFSGTINYLDEDGLTEDQQQKMLDKSIGDNIILHEKIIDEYRKDILYKKFDKKFEDFINDEIEDEEHEIHFEIKRYAFMNDVSIEEAKKHIIKKKRIALEEEMAKEELEFVKENNLYKSLENSWFTFNLYVPLNSESYSLFNRATETITSKRFYPVNGSVALTLYKKWNSGGAFYFTPKISIKNNNTILANEEATTTFQTTENFGNGVLLTQEEAYDVDYKSFMTSTIQAEIVWFPFNDTIGFSPSIERNFGEFRSVAWKLGIPVSFKDKEGKPTVNFELQWKEIRVLGEKSNHFIGISANFLFGKFVN